MHICSLCSSITTYMATFFQNSPTTLTKQQVSDHHPSYYYSLVLVPALDFSFRSNFDEVTSPTARYWLKLG